MLVEQGFLNFIDGLLWLQNGSFLGSFADLSIFVAFDVVTVRINWCGFALNPCLSSIQMATNPIANTSQF
jgi:hypothetical protein